MSSPGSTTPFGVTQKQRVGIPGVGSQGFADRPGPKVLSFDEIVGVPPPQPQGPPPPDAEPEIIEPVEEPLPREAFEPQREKAGPKVLSYDEIVEGSVATDPWVGEPFRRQKRNLRALGSNDEDIRAFDTYLDWLLKKPKADRYREFNADLENWEQYGLTAVELDDVRRNIGIYGMKEPLVDRVKGAMERHGAELVGAARATQALAGEILEKGERVRQAVVKPYRKHITPRLKESTEWQRQQMKNFAGIAVRSVGPGVEYYRDLIRSENWPGVKREVKWGLMPTMEELGEDFIHEQVGKIDESYQGEPRKRDAIKSLLRIATSSPSSSWMRRGEVPKWIDDQLWNELPQTKPKTAKFIAALYAPFEYVGDYVTNAEKYPEVLVTLLGTKYVVHPATQMFQRYASTKKWGTLPFKDAYKYYRTRLSARLGGKEVPINHETFMGFIQNSLNPDIKSHIVTNLTDKQLDATLKHLQTQLAKGGFSRKNLPMLEALMRKRNGNITFLVPKEPAALDLFAKNLITARPAAAALTTPPPKLLVPPPPGGTPGGAEIAQQFPSASRMAVTAEAAGSARDSQITAAIAGADKAHRISVRTNYSSEDVQFMRAIGMSDDEIITQAKEEDFYNPDLSMNPSVGDKVVIPDLKYREGELTDIDNPLKMQVTFDNGMKLTLPQDKIYHADQLKQRVPKPEVLFEDESALAEKIKNDQPVTDEELEAAPEVLRQLGYDELANRTLAKRKARDVRVAKTLYRESQVVTTSNAEEMAAKHPPQQDVTAQVSPDQQLDKTISEARTMAQRLQEPPPAPVEVDDAPVKAVTVEDLQAASVEPVADSPDPELPVEARLEDGTPITQVPLDEYLLQGVPEQLQAIKNLPAHRFGFSGVPTRQADAYVRAVGRTVQQHLPELMKEFTELKNKYEMQPGTVQAQAFDKFISKQHQLASRMTFAKEMQATGETDPGTAALITHRNAVQQAVAQGRPVPDAVLADYPDIKKGLVDKSQLTSTPTTELNTDLASRGYFNTDVKVLNDSDKEWLISNNIDPDTISILESGEIVNIPEKDRAKNHPDASKDITHADLEKEYLEERSISRRIADAWDDEAGFLFIPGGQTMKRLEVLWSRLNKRIHNMSLSVGDDIARSLESSIDKWSGELKVAEINADWEVGDFRELRKKIPTLTKPVFSKGKNPVKIADTEEELLIRYMDDPVYHANDYNSLSIGAKKLTKILQQDYQACYTIAKRHGVVKQFIENYTFRMYKNTPNKTASVQFGTSARVLSQQPPFAKERKYKHLRDAEAAGLAPIFDAGLLNSSYHLALNRTIAHKNLLTSLQLLKDSSGLPVIMGKPNPGSPYLKLWNDPNKYVTLSGFKALQQRLIIPLPGKRGLFITVEAKARPDVAKRLQQIFDPFIPRTKSAQLFMNVKHMIQRGKLWNFLFQRNNIYSDMIDEFNFDIMKIRRYQKHSKEAWNRRDKRILQMARNGLYLDTSRELATTMRAMQRDSTDFFAKMMAPLPKGEVIGKGVKWLLDLSDRFLWDYVRTSQISMCELLTEEFMKSHPKWSEDDAMRVAAHYTNVNLGRIPPHWMSPALRKITATVLFAPNWTPTNISMVVAAAKLPSLGVKSFSGEQREAFERNNLKHLVKGALALATFSAVWTMMNIHIQNQMKEHGVLDGAPMKVRPPFLFADKKNAFDWWLYRDKRGQDVFLVGYLFRYIRDMVNLVRDTVPTAMNKIDVMIGMGIQALTNYQRWNEQKVIPDGAKGYNHIKEGIKWFVQGITPFNQYLPKANRKMDFIDWVAPLTGTWISRSTRGGKEAALVWEYEEEKQYKLSKLRAEFSKAVDMQEFDKAMVVAMKIKDGDIKLAQKYLHRELGIRTMPLNSLIHGYSEKEKAKFFLWLEKKGQGVFKQSYSREKIIDKMAWEISDTILKRDKEVLEENPETYDDPDLDPTAINFNTVRRAIDEGRDIEPTEAMKQARKKAETETITPEQIPKGGELPEFLKKKVLSFEELQAPLR